MKRIFIWIGIFLCLILLIYVTSTSSPIRFPFKENVKRGNELIQGIENYIDKYDQIPPEDNWEALKEAGFTTEELATSHPQFLNLGNSSYQLVFIRGFDPPYLFWDSNDKTWKYGFPPIPNDDEK